MWLLSPVEGVDVVPKENPDVCPAGLNDELNNEDPVLELELKPVLVPNVEGAAAPNVDVVPNPVVLVLLPNNGVVVLFVAGWPKLVKPVVVDVDGILKADLFWLNSPILCNKYIKYKNNFDFYMQHIYITHYLVGLCGTKCRSKTCTLSSINTTKTCTSGMVSIAGTEKRCRGSCYK